MVHRLGLGEIERIIRRLERRHAAADAKFETPAAHLIEHADFLDQAQRMIERQQIHHRAEAQSLGTLGQRREKQAGRRGAADRRAVMFGKMVGVESGAVESLGEFEPAGIKLAVRHAGIVHVIENAEFHRPFPPQMRSRHNSGIEAVAGDGARRGSCDNGRLADPVSGRGVTQPGRAQPCSDHPGAGLNRASRPGYLLPGGKAPSDQR